MIFKGMKLQRARDMVEGIIPELQANIRLIAEEEVEIAALKNDIAQSQENLADAKKQISRLRDTLDVQQVSYNVNGRDYSRQHLAHRLALQFDHYKDSQTTLASKQRLLETREQSLEAAGQMLDRTRARKGHLEQQIESLVAKHRLLKAESVGTQLQIDGSQLAKAEKLIGQITKRLDVAERVLRHETDLLPTLSDEAISEKDLIEEVDEYFTDADAGQAADAELPDA
jgi:hypothetical protein